MVSRSWIWGARREALSSLESLLEVISLEVATESVRAGTYSKSCREGMNFRSCDAEAAGVKQSANKRNREQIGIWQSESTNRMMSMQGWMKIGRLRGTESAESDICYLELNAIFNGEPMELLEKSVWTEMKRTGHNTCKGDFILSVV